MKRSFRQSILILASVGLAILSLRAQNRLSFSPTSASSGHTALGLALRKLSVSGTFLQAPAHPDDETNALFAYFGYGMGLRVIEPPTPTIEKLLVVLTMQTAGVMHTGYPKVAL